MADENKEQDNIEKNIDLAIEAQDGKAAEPQNTETEGGETEENKVSETKQPEDSSGSGSNDKPQQQVDDKAGEKAKQPPHSAKDLTLSDGTVVKAGMERRFYEGRELARQREQAAIRERDSIQQKYADLETRFNQLDTSIKGVHGVDANTLRLGVNIVKDLQSDPAGTLKKLLAEAVAQGYKIEDIGQGIDIAAVEERIVARLRSEQSNNVDDDATIEREALQEATAFFSNHPDAKPHEPLIASMLRDHPALSLQDAYYQLKEAFIDKGFDWSLTLEDNLRAVGVDPANNGNQQQQDGNRAPLPAGGNAAGAEIKTADVVSLGADDMDTGDIVRQAMRESGLKI